MILRTCRNRVEAYTNTELLHLADDGYDQDRWEYHESKGPSKAFEESKRNYEREIIARAMAGL
ncbi:hypothetical protein SD80_028600 [Scytonema tolypothrichoides VB-61278]|nr:hypothetical protein SD80_028600 [Scytonema tolypothrichoides VB-61278]